jgi:uncharacterized protein YndB with AHSA1/START domain
MRIELQRTIPASPERVYRAWLEPDLLRRWMAGGSREVTGAEVDERVGGRFSIEHGEAGGFEAEILELDAGERIVWLWGFVGPQRDAGPRFDSLLTVTFAERADGATELTLVHERLEALAEAMPEVAEKVEAGWDSALAKLEAAVGQPAATG